MQRNPHSYQIATGYRTFYSLSLIYQPITKKRLFLVEKLKPLQELVEGADVATDNKELRKRLETAFEELTEAICIKSALLDHVLKNDFLRKRAILSMEEKEPQKSKKRE